MVSIWKMLPLLSAPQDPWASTMSSSGLWLQWLYLSPTAQQVTTHSTCLCSTLQVVQRSAPELIPSAYLNGNEKRLPWNRSFFIPWPFMKFWKEKVKILESNYRRITSLPMLVSPLSVGCEYFTPEHCMGRRVTKCTALLSLQVANTSS